MKLSESRGFGPLRESLVRDRLILKRKTIREKHLGKRDLDPDKAIKASQVTHSWATEIAANEDVNQEVGQKSQPNRGKTSRRKPPSKDTPKIKEYFAVVHMHWKALNLCPTSGQKCTSEPKKTILQLSVEASLKIQKFPWLKRQEVFFMFIVLVIKIKQPHLFR